MLVPVLLFKSNKCNCYVALYTPLSSGSIVFSLQTIFVSVFLPGQFAFWACTVWPYSIYKLLYFLKKTLSQTCQSDKHCGPPEINFSPVWWKRLQVSKLSHSHTVQRNQLHTFLLHPFVNENILSWSQLQNSETQWQFQNRPGLEYKMLRLLF